MATGDITAVTIRATGWDADVTILGFSTATTYNYTDPITGTNKFRLSVTTSGYDASKGTTTPTRTIYGTAIVRKAYPNHASLDETTSGSDVIIRLALSSRIRTGDTVTLDADAGAFTQGGNSNAVSSLSCTNSSGVGHPTAFASWAQRPFDRWQSNPTLAVTARHMYGISAVDIILSDAHSNTVTTACTLQSRQRAATSLYAEEWAATCDLSTLTQGDAITARFKVYPTIGNAITDSNSQTVNADNTTLGICDFTYYNDKNATADVYAVVDGVSGNDTTGTSSATLATAAASPYLTIGKALTVGTANVIYLRSGSVYNVLGSTVTAPSSLGYWRQVKVYPGDGATTVELTGTATYNTPHLSYEGLTYRLNTGNTWFDGVTGARYLSFKNCTMDANGRTTATTSGFGYRSACVYFTGCAWSDLSAFGLQNNFAARVCHWFDGCDLTSTTQINITSVWRVAACACKQTSFGTKDQGSSTGPTNDPFFFEFNKVMNANRVGGTILLSRAAPSSGMSIAGNIFERPAGTSPSVQISADSSVEAVNHVLLWHNTIAGERCNAFYQDTGTTAYLKENVSMQYNAFAGGVTAGGYNIKSDTFGTQSGNRIGNWAVLYGVDCFGNAENASSGFNQAFPGIGTSSSEMDLGGEGSTDATVATMAFTADYSVTGTGAGNGDYTPLSTSDLRGSVLAGRTVLMHDMFGRVIGNGSYGGALQPTAVVAGLLLMGCGS